MAQSLVWPSCGMAQQSGQESSSTVLKLAKAVSHLQVFRAAICHSYSTPPTA